MSASFTINEASLGLVPGDLALKQSQYLTAYLHTVDLILLCTKSITAVIEDKLTVAVDVNSPGGSQPDSPAHSTLMHHPAKAA